jgi:hypothetical protein
VIGRRKIKKSIFVKTAGILQEQAFFYIIISRSSSSRRNCEPFALPLAVIQEDVRTIQTILQYRSFYYE